MTSCFVWLKAQKQTRKRSFRVFSRFVPILELTQILRQMLAKYVDMSAANTVFQAGPDTFNRDGVVNAVFPLFELVLDSAMLTEFYISALLVDEELADQVWEA